jgi:hypothetical protein
MCRLQGIAQIPKLVMPTMDLASPVWEQQCCCLYGKLNPQRWKMTGDCNAADAIFV